MQGRYIVSRKSTSGMSNRQKRKGIDSSWVSRLRSPSLVTMVFSHCLPACWILYMLCVNHKRRLRYNSFTWNFFSDCCNKLFSYHCFFQSDVYICMELMTTCLDKLMKKLKGPIPEDVLGKISVSVSLR